MLPRCAYCAWVYKTDAETFALKKPSRTAAQISSMTNEGRVAIVKKNDKRTSGEPDDRPFNDKATNYEYYLIFSPGHGSLNMTNDWSIHAVSFGLSVLDIISSPITLTGGNEVSYVSAFEFDIFRRFDLLALDIMLSACVETS